MSIRFGKRPPKSLLFKGLRRSWESVCFGLSGCLFCVHCYVVIYANLVMQADRLQKRRSWILKICSKCASA